MNGAAIAALVPIITTVAVALLGGVVAFLGHKKDSVDRRLNLILDGNQALLDDYSEANDRQRRRLDELEAAHQATRAELGRVREMLQEQGLEIVVLRQQNTDWRTWANDVTAWCAMAMGIVSGLGSTIAAPPPVPHHPPF